MDRPLFILLVDDEEIVQETITGFLEALGHRVEVVSDGHAALDTICGCGEYDLALIDVRMPGIDGLTLLEKSRRIRPEMPVVMVTGHGDPTMSQRAMDLGATDFLIKPFRLADLDAILQKVRANP